jgi:hypothetical protein
MSAYTRIVGAIFKSKPTEAELTELIGDILEYCRSEGIRAERLIIDAVLERMQ